MSAPGPERCHEQRGARSKGIGGFTQCRVYFVAGLEPGVCRKPVGAGQQAVAALVPRLVVLLIQHRY
jgi:hypothetical protein